MKTEVFDDPKAFLAAVQGKKRTKAGGKDIPRGPQGEGDRIAQLGRIAFYGYGPRCDADQGFSFWNPRTGARTSLHDTYVAACIAAERELKS